MVTVPLLLVQPVGSVIARLVTDDIVKVCALAEYAVVVFDSVGLSTNSPAADAADLRLR